MTNDKSPGHAFHRGHWTTNALCWGIVFLVAWRVLGAMELSIFETLPMWLGIGLAVVLPQCLLIAYAVATRQAPTAFLESERPQTGETPDTPLATGEPAPPLAQTEEPLREPASRQPLQPPTAKQWIQEPLIALAVTISTLFALALVNSALSWLAPKQSMTPESLQKLAMSPQYAAVIFMLVFAFTVAPVAEELFFRGFLQNALAERMPRWAATLAQCVIFGACHFYGPLHIVIVILLGLVLTLVYQWRQTLLTPMIVHGGINFVSSLGLLALMAAHAASPVLGVRCENQSGPCVISEVVAGTPADQAQLAAGDTIAAINETPVHNFLNLRLELARYKAGDEVTLTIERDGERLNISLVLAERPTANANDEAANESPP